MLDRRPAMGIMRIRNVIVYMLQKMNIYAYMQINLEQTG